MSDWTEGRTWRRVVRGETRAEDAFISISREQGQRSYHWEVVMVEVPAPTYGVAGTLREAKAKAYAEWLVMTGRLVRARGGA